MKKTSSFLAVFAATATVLLTCFQAQATPVVITNVPAYVQLYTSYTNEAKHWTGCYPTATAMALGYYKLHDYNNLFKTNGVAVYSTTNVLTEIGKLATLMKTDSSGWTVSSNLIPAIIGYTRSGGYFFSATAYTFEGGTTAANKAWKIFTNEVSNCRPMLFFVNSTIGGNTDHLVTAIGYEDKGPIGHITNRWYACYNTYSEAETNIMWYKFQVKSSSSYYGVSTMTQIKSKGRGGMIRIF